MNKYTLFVGVLFLAVSMSLGVSAQVGGDSTHRPIIMEGVPPASGYQLPVIADGVVNQNDLNYFNLCWNGKVTVKPIPSYCLRADFNKDGQLDETDSRFINGCLGAEVLKARPECAKADTESQGGAGKTEMSPIQYGLPSVVGGGTIPTGQLPTFTKVLIETTGGSTNGGPTTTGGGTLPPNEIPNFKKATVETSSGQTFIFEKPTIVQSETVKAPLISVKDFDKSVTVQTNEAIAVKNNKVYVGEKEITVMPSIAIKKALEGIGSSQPVQVELKTVGDQMNYSVTTQKKQKLFGFIPISLSVSVQVDAMSGVASPVKKPWWSFLTF